MPILAEGGALDAPRPFPPPRFPPPPLRPPLFLEELYEVLLVLPVLFRFVPSCFFFTTPPYPPLLLKPPGPDRFEAGGRMPVVV